MIPRYGHYSEITDQFPITLTTDKEKIKLIYISLFIIKLHTIGKVNFYSDFNSKELQISHVSWLHEIVTITGIKIVGKNVISSMGCFVWMIKRIYIFKTQGN